VTLTAELSTVAAIAMLVRSAMSSAGENARVPGDSKDTTTGGGSASVGDVLGAAVVGETVGAAVVGDTVGAGVVGEPVGAAVVGADAVGVAVVGASVGQSQRARMAALSLAPHLIYHSIA
jgi:hypothetical protein